jgi:TPR repeat protein
MVNLGLIYANGKGVIKDLNIAFQWWRRAIALGDDLAAAMLGLSLAQYSKNEKELLQAARLLEWAAGEGYGEAAYMLGALYQSGRGVARDETRSIEWLHHAVRLGHPVAAFTLASVFETQNQPDKAIKLLRMAAEKGYGRAQALLGDAYIQGLGVPRNLKVAANWSKKAATQGDAVGQSTFAYLLSTGKGIKRNKAEAARFYLLAAKQGHGAAAHNLSMMLLLGDGVVRDYVDGAKWAALAASQGEPTAINNLAHSLSKGLGVKRDPAAAVELFRRAAKFGQPNAMHSLAGILRRGRGVDRNPAEAYYWIVLAERLYEKNSPARDNAGLFKRQLYGRLAIDGIDRKAIERRAARFVPEQSPALVIPPPKPYEGPVEKTTLITLEDAMPQPNKNTIPRGEIPIRNDFAT